MFGIQQVTCYTIKDLNVMLIKMALSFDDTLLVPKRTFGGSRKNVDLSTIICGYKMKIPIFSANMSSVTEAKMAIAMRNHGGLGVIHRMCTPKEQYEMVNEVYCRLYEADLTHTPVFVSIEGTKDDAIERIKNIEHLYPYGYCIDVAHANSPDVEETIKAIIEEFPNINLIVGNYATPEGIMYLLDAVPDISLDRIAFKVGIGSGCFSENTLITTMYGDKLIKDVDIGDWVLTHSGEYYPVIKTFKRFENECLYSINGTNCTKQHEFYVLNKKFIDIITDDNLEEYSEFIKAEELNEDYFLIEKCENYKYGIGVECLILNENKN